LHALVFGLLIFGVLRPSQIDQTDPAETACVWSAAISGAELVAASK